MPIKTVKKEVLEEVLEDVICDACEKSCSTQADFEYAHLLAYWGYGSHKDCTIWDYIYCEECSNKIMKFIESLKGKK